MTLTLGFGFALMLIGLWGLVTRKNMIKMVLSLAIAETGLHLVMISIGFIGGRTAPILDGVISDAINQVVDPVPQALVLTAIVIGFAVNALMLAFVIRLFQKKNSLNTSDFKELKW